MKEGWSSGSCGGFELEVSAAKVSCLLQRRRVGCSGGVAHTQTLPRGSGRSRPESGSHLERPVARGIRGEAGLSVAVKSSKRRPPHADVADPDVKGEPIGAPGCSRFPRRRWVASCQFRWIS